MNKNQNLVEEVMKRINKIIFKPLIFILCFGFTADIFTAASLYADGNNAYQTQKQVILWLKLPLTVLGE